MRSDADFVLNVLKGLGKAATSDVDVCLLAVSGLVGGRRGLSRALLAYVIARRADQYMGVLASKMDQLAFVMANE